MIGFLNDLGSQSEDVKIHIEIGTGMGRTGIHPRRIEEYLEMIKQYSNIIIDGIYTHLSSADIDLKYVTPEERVENDIASGSGGKYD